MSTPGAGEELRRYRALAWALVATLIVSVALFVQFLRIDRLRAQDAFFASAVHAATNGGLRVERLIERLDRMGRGHLSGADERRSLSLMHALDVDPALVSLCAREGDAVRVLHAAAADASDTTGERCAAPFVPSQTLVAQRSGADPPTEVRIVASPHGQAPSLEFRVHDGGARELRTTLSSEALLDALVRGNAGLDENSGTVCLSLRVGGRFRELTCHLGATARAAPEAFGTIDAGMTPWVEELETAGLRWRVAILPDPLSLAGTITPLPFVMFGIALAIGALACAFAYRAVDKNILLETRANELRRRLEQLERLEERNDLLDHFAAMAAHDLQAPIRFMVSTAHLLIDELDELDRPDLSRMAATQVEQGDRMRALVIDLLEFCRAGQSRLTTAPVDMRALVEAEVRLLEAHAEYAGTDVHVGPLPKSLTCDADKLTRIIRNLLGNAVKFSQGRSTPKVSIGARRDTLHGKWTFRVSDNGPGVDEAHRERIFRPFARLDSNAEGTGMGLAIVKIMIEQHGGTIWVESGDGEGSTFCFTIPGSMPAGSLG